MSEASKHPGTLLAPHSRAPEGKARAAFAMARITTGSRQNGSFLIILPLAVLSLFGVIGLTLTSSHAFLDRSRLQNLIDAMALTAAQTVNEENTLTSADQDKKCQAGVEQALKLFDRTTQTFGNGTLLTALGDDAAPRVEFSYATALDGQFAATCPDTDPEDAIYVRTTLRGLRSANLHQALTGLARDIRVSASAVAGPASIDTPLCPLPIYVCDRSNDAGRDPRCTDPDAPGCAFGHPKNVELCGNLSGDGDQFCGDATVGLLDWDDDGHLGELANGLAGCALGSCPNRAPRPGDQAPVAQYAGAASDKRNEIRVGFNTRFFGSNWPSLADATSGSSASPPNDPPASDPLNCSETSLPAPDRVSASWDADSDTKHAAGIGVGTIPDQVAPPLSQRYLRGREGHGETASLLTLSDSRRMVAIPVVQPCPTPGSAAPPVTVRGYACALLTRPMLSLAGQTRGTSDSIVLQLVDGCTTRGLIGPNNGAITRIVLYKDPGSGNS